MSKWLRETLVLLNLLGYELSDHYRDFSRVRFNCVMKKPLGAAVKLFFFSIQLYTRNKALISSMNRMFRPVIKPTDNVKLKTHGIVFCKHLFYHWNYRSIFSFPKKLFKMCFCDWFLSLLNILPNVWFQLTLRLKQSLFPQHIPLLG